MRAFSGPLTGDAAEKRLTEMIELGNSLECAEQPIIELESGEIWSVWAPVRVRLSLNGRDAQQRREVTNPSPT